MRSLGIYLDALCINPGVIQTGVVLRGQVISLDVHSPVAVHIEAELDQSQMTPRVRRVTPIPAHD